MGTSEYFVGTLNLAIFQAQILSKCIGSGYLGVLCGYRELRHFSGPDTIKVYK